MFTMNSNTNPRIGAQTDRLDTKIDQSVFLEQDDDFSMSLLEFNIQIEGINAII